MMKLMQYKASKQLLPRYLIHQQGLQFKLQAVLTMEAQDKKHPAFHMGYGNRKSLDKPDIPKKVKEFYDAYYDKSKVTMLTIGNKESFDINGLKKELETSIRTSSMKPYPAKDEHLLMLHAPKTPQDTYILLDHKSSNVIQYMYIINLEAEDLTHLTFVKIVLKRVLDEMLIRKNKVALSVSVSSDFKQNFAFLSIEVVPTISARKFPAQIHAAVADLVQNIYQYLDKYDDMAIFRWKEYMLQSKSSSTMSRLSQMLRNLELFGIGKMFSGDSLLEKYRESTMASILTQLRETGRYVTVVGNFDKEKEFTNNFNLLFSEEVSKNDGFGADTSAKSKLRLNRRVEEYEVDYASTTLSRHFSDALIRDAIKDKRLELPKVVTQDEHVPTIKQIQDLMNYVPGKNRQKLETGQVNYTDFSNDKYNIPMASFYMLMNFDQTVNKKAYLDVSYWLSILKFRLLPILMEATNFRNSIALNHDTTGLSLSINSLPQSSLSLLKSLIGIIKTKEITQEEHEFAIDLIYRIGQVRDKPSNDASSAISRYVYEDSPSQADKSAYAKEHAKFVKDKNNMRELKIGLIHYEHAGESMKFKQAQDELKDFKFGATGFANNKLRIPEKDKTILIRVEKSNPDDKSIGFSACNFVGENKPREIALAFTLNRLLSNVAFDYLRTQMKLGYVAYTMPMRVQSHLAFCLIIQGDKDLSLTQTEAEKFWQVADKYLSDVTDQQVEQMAKIILQLNTMPFRSLKEETEYYFDRLRDGNSLEYKSQIMEELAKVKKADIVTFFDTHFKKETRRVIAEAVNKDRVTEPTAEEMKTFNLLNSKATIVTKLNV